MDEMNKFLDDIYDLAYHFVMENQAVGITDLEVESKLHSHWSEKLTSLEVETEIYDAIHDALNEKWGE